MGAQRRASTLPPTVNALTIRCKGNTILADNCRFSVKSHILLHKTVCNAIILNYLYATNKCGTTDDAAQYEPLKNLRHEPFIVFYYSFITYDVTKSS